MSIDARYPGSCNDKFIFKKSGLRDIMKEAYWDNHCWLLGYSGYTYEPWMQLPLPHATPETPEGRYTKLHCRARSKVERCIGLLKARWRCLLNDRTLHYSPVKAGGIVNACAVLHNFVRQHNVLDSQPIVLPDPEDVFEDWEETIARNGLLGLPRVLGLVDGTLVKIFPPKLAEFREGYYCRKGYTALNVQVVS
ncbi:putative nuclease HARBI1 [Frankliniella occidentalis]|uniref:Nuclease HARBI1 n=1 Tax=Frankliniella occidentalis TaxID=133901 RepID=A0A9C6U7Q0_FRAOC|nr:putative nuclease HARBI1 [Frankliniella occidentalis]